MIGTPVAPTEIVPLTLEGVNLEHLPQLQAGFVVFLNQKTHLSVSQFDHHSLGVIASVDKIVRNDDGLNVLCTGRQRCELIEEVPFHSWVSTHPMLFYSNQVKVKVLPDIELPPICHDFSPVVSHLDPKTVRVL